VHLVRIDDDIVRRAAAFARSVRSLDHPSRHRATVRDRPGWDGRLRSAPRRCRHDQPRHHGHSRPPEDHTGRSGARDQFSAASWVTVTVILIVGQRTVVGVCAMT
jgi:hypothetical protein